MAEKFKILIVDDDPDKRQLLMFAFQMDGYDVYTAPDGVLGLTIINSVRPDLIIVDAKMPTMDGYELTRRIRENSETQFIPVLIQSASGNEARNVRRSLEAGALGYVADPADFELFLVWCRNLLDFKRHFNAYEEAILQPGHDLLITAEVQDTASAHNAERRRVERRRAERRREASSILERKMEAGEFDVFLCHNSEDKPEVKEIGRRLAEQGILPWLDEWNLRPGLPWQIALEHQIEKIKAAAVFVGKNGIGPWQENELNAFLREFVARKCSVIPVLLSSAPGEPKLPIFLRNMTWVDFRKPDPDPMKQLCWGVTGERPFNFRGSSEA
jgi:DNA-binding response OmpR family regulator